MILSCRRYLSRSNHACSGLIRVPHPRPGTALERGDAALLIPYRLPLPLEAANLRPDHWTGRVPAYFIFQAGLRFSEKARGPSIASSVAWMRCAMGAESFCEYSTGRLRPL